jgi:ABC-type lipoprotein release transport system permease subunit
VTGIAIFELDAEGQYTVACTLPLLQEMMGQTENDPVSVILVKLTNATNAEQISSNINKEFPQLSAYTIRSVIHAVDKQLSYFKQFAFILGGISLVTTFVLIFIITTISFHDRVGEVALLRAIGLSHKTIFTTVLFEGVLTSLASAAIGFVIGKAVSVYLDLILKSAPGLPEDFSFFVMEPQSVIRAFLILILTGFIAGLYPAAAAVRLPVAQTLREEIL